MQEDTAKISQKESLGSLSKTSSNAGRPKSLQKRHSILEAAGRAFLSHGFERSSMDSVAKESGVSKQTVYSHFKNKDALFNAVIESKCEFYQLEASSLVDKDKSLMSILENFALKFIQLLSDKEVIAMYNTVIGEAQNTPHIAKLFYDAGPVHGIDLIRQLLVKHPQSQLSTENANEVSIDFFNLLKGEYHMRSLLHLPVSLDEKTIKHKARRCAQKTMLIVEHCFN